MEVCFEKYKTARTGIRTVGAIAISYFAYLIIAKLSDNSQISFDVLTSFILKVSASVGISWTITGASIILTFRYRNLMRKKIKVLAPYKDMVEKEVWKAKISSNINEDGTTPKEFK